MIATIKSEWRKNRFRPAFLMGAALIAALPLIATGINWYMALNPGKSDHPVQLASLYPDHFVLNVLGAGFPLGAAMAIVLGAILAGSEFGWGTLKTSLTQGPGRLTFWFGRTLVFVAWMFILTAILFVLGATASSVVAIGEGHAITWPDSKAPEGCSQSFNPAGDLRVRGAANPFAIEGSYLAIGVDRGSVTKNALNRQLAILHCAQHQTAKSSECIRYAR